jgi:hypothetical protein
LSEITLERVPRFGGARAFHDFHYGALPRCRPNGVAGVDLGGPPNRSRRGGGKGRHVGRSATMPRLGPRNGPRCACCHGNKLGVAARCKPPDSVCGRPTAAFGIGRTRRARLLRCGGADRTMSSDACPWDRDPSLMVRICCRQAAMSKQHAATHAALDGLTLAQVGCDGAGPRHKHTNTLSSDRVAAA